MIGFRELLLLLGLCFITAGGIGGLFYSINLNDYFICLIYLVIGMILIIGSKIKQEENEVKE